MVLLNLVFASRCRTSSPRPRGPDRVAAELSDEHAGARSGAGRYRGRLRGAFRSHTPGGGALADDPARRRTIAVGGYASTAVVFGLLGAAASVWQVGVLGAAAWTARGLRVPPPTTLLADVVPRKVYGALRL